MWMLFAESRCFTDAQSAVNNGETADFEGAALLPGGADL
jgi:hypothetical protein